MAQGPAVCSKGGPLGVYRSVLVLGGSQPVRACAAGAGAGTWRGPARCHFDLAAGAVVVTGAGGSPQPPPIKPSRLKRLLKGHAKAPAAAPDEQVIPLDSVRLVELDARSLSIELPPAGRPGAALGVGLRTAFMPGQDCLERADKAVVNFVLKCGPLHAMQAPGT